MCIHYLKGFFSFPSHFHNGLRAMVYDFQESVHFDEHLEMHRVGVPMCATCAPQKGPGRVASCINCFVRACDFHLFIQDHLDSHFVLFLWLSPQRLGKSCEPYLWADQVQQEFHAKRVDSSTTQWGCSLQFKF